MLEFYQQAIKIQLLPTQPLLAQSAPAGNQTETVTDLAAPEPGAPFDVKVHAHIADELQRLITELDFAGAVGESLADIRRQLLNGITPPLLAEICLQVIELIIEGTREERKASQAFSAPSTRVSRRSTSASPNPSTRGAPCKAPPWIPARPSTGS